MTLRARLALLAAVAVAIAVVVVSVVAFRASSAQQRDALDDALLRQAGETARRAGVAVDIGAGFGPRAQGILTAEGLVQVIDADGDVLRPSGQAELPVSDQDREVAGGAAARSLRDITVDGESFRLATVPIEDGLRRIRPPGAPGGSGDPGGGPTAADLAAGDVAVQVARSLEPIDDSLRDLRITLLVMALLGVAGAGVAGLVVSRRALQPVRALTESAEEVARTQDLAATIPIHRRDEIGRLAESLNAMLGALGESREQQRRLVVDAGHELRTPLTALRTNIELLQRADALPTDERIRMLDEGAVDDAVVELEELSTLVAELVDLATDARRDADDWGEVRVDEIVDSVAERFTRRRSGPVEVVAEPLSCRASPALLERAVTNLVDNASKWSGDDQPIEVSVADGAVRVRDRGPGIDSEHRPRVFDRFYRAPGSQDRPGSGLGLAIVAQVAEAHGGEVFVEDPPDGPGVVVGFTLPERPVGP